MKAICRKINGEWIAEVRVQADEKHYIKWGSETMYVNYPIPSSTDKEFLESNNMEGKEIEGQLLENYKGRDMNFSITLPLTPQEKEKDADKVRDKYGVQDEKEENKYAFMTKLDRKRNRASIPGGEGKEDVFRKLLEEYKILLENHCYTIRRHNYVCDDLWLRTRDALASLPNPDLAGYKEPISGQKVYPNSSEVLSRESGHVNLSEYQALFNENAQLGEEICQLNEELAALASHETEPPGGEEELMHELADFAHKQWSGWMEYLFSKGEINTDGTFTIAKWAVDRWTKQSKTEYMDLTQQEKNSDLSEARKMMAIIKKFKTTK